MKNLRVRKQRRRRNGENNSPSTILNLKKKKKKLSLNGLQPPISRIRNQQHPQENKGGGREKYLWKINMTQFPNPPSTPFFYRFRELHQFFSQTQEEYSGEWNNNKKKSSDYERVGGLLFCWGE